MATLAAVQAERCTALYGVPTMFIAELGHPEFGEFDLTSLRTGIMAGSPCPVEVISASSTEMRMSEVTICYGMTETSPVSTQTRPDDDSNAAWRRSDASCRTSRSRSPTRTAARRCRAASPASYAPAATR